MTDVAEAQDDRIAAELRGFGPLGIAAIVVIMAANVVTVLPAAALVLVWVWRSRTPWREIGYARPRSWIVTVVGGIVLGVALKLALKAIVMPLLGVDPVNHAYHFLVGNARALPGMLAIVIVAGGFGEETVYRGYLFERIGKILGEGAPARTFTVLLTSALFASAHFLDQGVAGVEQAMITGLVFGSVFAITRRVWLLMVAHAAYDVAAIALIYWNVESRVAHLFFR
jgi:CAAX protease family protein